MADRLWTRAERDLCMRLSGRGRDPIVWEHSRRVACLVEAIAGLGEAAGDSADPLALAAAGLYHDMGWVLQVQTGALNAPEVLLRPTSDTQLALAAEWASTHLRDVLPGASLELATRAIRSINDRQTDLIEAQILAEADNLDQIGPQTIVMMVRKQQAEGKTLEDLVAAWQRQEEYHYWQARIKECFRFPAVRAIAERRWQALRRFMADLHEAVQVGSTAQPLPPAQPNRSSTQSGR